MRLPKPETSLVTSIVAALAAAVLVTLVLVSAAIRKV